MAGGGCDFKPIMLISFVFVLFTSLVSAQLTRPVPDVCANDNEYFDSTSMRCEICSDTTGAIRDSTGLSCTCRPGYIIKKNFGGKSIECQACNSSTVPSSDRRSCVRCGSNENGAARDIVSASQTCSECVPDTTAFISVNRDLRGTLTNASCISCVTGTFPNDDNTRCVRCSKILETGGDSTCQCNTNDKTALNGYCFLNSNLPPNSELTYTVPLPNEGEGKESSYVTENLVASYALCKKYSNSTSCQLLGNLCAASFSSQNTYSCKLYLRDPASTDVSIRQIAIINWPDDIPWLYYAGSGDSTLNLADIPTKFSLKKNSIDNSIKLYVAVHTLNGTYIGLQSVQGGKIQLCPNTAEKTNAPWSFGTAYEDSCEIRVYDLMSMETLFYDLYIQYYQDGAPVLYPIPVLVKNYRDANGDEPNKSGDRGSWQLVRRFFLVDNGLFPGTQRPETVRYVRNMQFHFTLLTSGEGRIYTPYVSLEYDYRNDADVDGNTTVTSSFGVSYELNSGKFTYDLTVALSTLGSFAGLMAMMKTYSWARRAGNASFPLLVIKFIAFSCGTLGNSMLLALMSIALWWLIFFKSQDIVYLLPVSNSAELFFRDFLICTFCLKICDILHLFASQINIDVFLMDWEKPKAGGKEKQTENGDKTTEKPSVSIWRTYFVANEWNEIQTARKICPLFQLFIVLAFLKVFGFENLCSKDRRSDLILDPGSYSSPHSKMFRFGLMAFIWICSAILQWIFFTLIWERFVDDKVHQFVDLCSMANVSVFIMENSQYGYYIHGRSPHGIADTGMKEMSMQLKRETENLCAHRGLEEGSDEQTFRMSLPPQLRAKYDEIFRTLNDKKRFATQRRLAEAYDRFVMYNPDTPQANPDIWPTDIRNVARAPTSRTGEADLDKKYQDIEANKRINKFLSDFIDHSLRDLDYTIRDRIFFESILDIEFEQVFDKGIFYHDNGHSFDHVLYYGHELTLTTFEITIFGFVDMFSSSGFVLCAIVTYFVSLFLKLLRDGIGRRNLAQKTLVDERFLI